MYAVDPATVNRLRQTYTKYNKITNDPVVKTALELKKLIPEILKNKFLTKNQKQSRFALAMTRLIRLLKKVDRKTRSKVLEEIVAPPPETAGEDREDPYVAGVADLFNRAEIEMPDDENWIDAADEDDVEEEDENNNVEEEEEELNYQPEYYRGETPKKKRRVELQPAREAGRNQYSSLLQHFPDKKKDSVNLIIRGMMNDPAIEYDKLSQNLVIDGEVVRGMHLTDILVEMVKKLNNLPTVIKNPPPIQEPVRALLTSLALNSNMPAEAIKNQRLKAYFVEIRNAGKPIPVPFTKYKPPKSKIPIRFPKKKPHLETIYEDQPSTSFATPRRPRPELKRLQKRSHPSNRSPPVTSRPAGYLSSYVFSPKAT